MKHPPDWLHGPAELRRVVEDLSAVERVAGPPREPYPEELGWDGTEFDVETMSDDGMHTVVDIRVRHGVRASSGRDGPSEEETVTLRSVVRALLDLAEVGSGRARTTVVLTGEGPRVTSCRIGAGKPVSLLEEGVRYRG